MRHVVLIAGMAAALCAGTARASEVELKNDGFEAGGTAAFQGGFVSGEIGAAVFEAGEADYPLRILRVEALFGGGSEGESRDVDLVIWEHAADEVEPGSILYEDTYSLTSSSDAINVMDLSASGVTVDSGPFRVGLRMAHDGYPGIARDDDGILTHANLVYTGGTWMWAEDLAIAGDWIIRVTVDTADPVVEEGVAEVVDASEDAIDDAGGDDATSPDVPSDADPECASNADCPAGHFCTWDGLCEQDCASDADCPADQYCNGIGQCDFADPAGRSGGCAVGSGAGRPALPAILVLLGITLLLGMRPARKRHG